ncbi:hypothetical protein CRG98_035007 [Punica granatum]|uniref:Uncharacterized protein n=1 Tax=Punica granatum TaxID=22663 RepID=A0A2I0IKX8_PUNGR|nr:hypothetical protein CRG98_035007 [Punica granatum]
MHFTHVNLVHLHEEGINLLTVIKGTRTYRRSRRHDDISDFLPPSMWEFKTGFEQIIGLLRYACSSVEQLRRFDDGMGVDKLEILWDDGYGSMTIKDYLDASKEILKPDGGPPRWFCPIECGQPLKDSPVLLFLPGNTCIHVSICPGVGLENSRVNFHPIVGYVKCHVKWVGTSAVREGK